uniref:G-protein coupled receptors family 1 profile domain-containing protein n=1 Tax=Amphimedon queenslandica TaxID=400682 RepID=A0A1X7TU63_AMPQE
MDEVNDTLYTFTGSVNTYVLAAVFVLEFIAGFIFNTIVIGITIYKGSWKKQGTIFFTSLILANLLLVILYIPFLVIGLAARKWIFGNTVAEKLASCWFVGFALWYSFIIILMTLAAISLDRFLFVIKPHFHKWFMRPWVTLTLTIAIWILSAVLSSTPFYGLGTYAYGRWYGSCVPLWVEIGFIIYSVTISLLVIAVIVITSVWVFCFTRIFIKVHPEVEVPADPDTVICLSKKKRLFGIYGSMLLAYTVCFAPTLISSIISSSIDIPGEVFFLNVITFFLITVVSPLIQSYFRKDIKEVIVLCYKKITKKQ